MRHGLPASQQTGRFLPRLCLVLWILYLILSILWDVDDPLPKKAPGTFDLASYEKIIQFPERIFPGYFFTALDTVRSLANPIFHMGRRSFLSATTFFLIVLTLSGYCAGFWSSGEETDGLFAAVFVSSSPFIATVSRVYDIHLPHLAAIGVVLAFLVLFRKSPSVRNGILLTLVFALAIIVNSSTTEYLFFGLALAAPLTVVFLTAVIEKVHRRIYIAAGACLITMIVVASPSILNSVPYSGWIPGDARIFGTGFSALFYSTEGVWKIPEALFAYPYVFWRATLSWPLNIILVLGFILFLFRRDALRWYWLPSVFIPLALLILLPKRNIYYISNILPAFCVCAALGFGLIVGRFGRFGRYVVLVVFLMAVTYNLAVVNQWIPSGRIDDKWLPYFVPGKTTYKPHYYRLGFEGFGSRVLQEDSLSMKLTSSVLASVPRPVALAFVGNPCIQDRTIMELAYQGIYSRDLVCSNAKSPLLPSYDVIVIYPLLKDIPGLYSSRNLMEAFDSLERTVAADHPLSKALYPDEALYQDEDCLNEKNHGLLSMLHRAKPEFERLSDRFTEVRLIDGFLLFIEPPKKKYFMSTPARLRRIPDAGLAP